MQYQVIPQQNLPNVCYLVIIFNFPIMKKYVHVNIGKKGLMQHHDNNIFLQNTYNRHPIAHGGLDIKSVNGQVKLHTVGCLVWV